MRPKRTIPMRDLRDDARLSSRFWNKVQIGESTECWPFLGYKTPLGYGKIGVDGRAHFASRIAWQLTYGPLDEGVCVLHHCDFPPCVNPVHLYAGTMSQNMRDMWDRRRHRPPVNRSGKDWRPKGTGRARGERHPDARLTAEAVVSIRRDAADGMSLETLARRHGVTRQSIWALVHRHTWKHV
jgi:hypothetical protein